MFVGRNEEHNDLSDILNRREAQLVVVYGRRRVGKTFLIREFFHNRFFFYHTGMHGCGMKEQLLAFRDSLVEYGLGSQGMISNWHEAFLLLRRLIESAPGGSEKKVVFLDELPWMDTPRSSFLTSFEYFWNSWASSRDDLLVIVCGSASSWIINKVLKNHGGLYNRVTERIMLKPFTLGECEQYAQAVGLPLTRREICSYYMVFGGIPFYWSLLKKGLGVPQNIDRLFFKENGKLRYEYDDLFSSLFSDADDYKKIVEALSKANRGLTRTDILQLSGLKDGGKFSNCLETLEKCGFIQKYVFLGKRRKDGLYQLMDNLVRFHFKFLNGKARDDENFWSANYLSPKHNAWAGLAFEHLCLQHIRQVKTALQIGGVSSSDYSWFHRADMVHPEGAQIDLLINRADQVINLCEIKYCNGRFSPDKSFISELLRKRHVLESVGKVKKAIHLTLITPEGMVENAYSHDIQSVVTLDDLFAMR